LGNLFEILIRFVTWSICPQWHSRSGGITDFSRIFDVVKAVNPNLTEQGWQGWEAIASRLTRQA
jgi:hypothetical protein